SAAQAQVAHSRTSNLDLSSTATTAQARVQPGQTAVINVGGTPVTVSSGVLLTPAEQIAVSQVVHTGHPSIVLGAAGDAIGGTVNLSHISAAINNLVIPAGVTALRDFGRSTTLSVLGNLTNGGNFYGFSSNPAVQTATIAATNITNLQNAVLSSVLPT